VSLSIKAGGGPISQPDPRPWDVTLSASTSPGTYDGSIEPGTVAGIIPDNIWDSFSVNETFTYWICTLATDGKQVTSATISTDTSPPDPSTLIPSALPASVKFVFALSKEGYVWRTIGSGNPLVTSWMVIETDKTETPPPGIPGVDRWYNLAIS
jgi:hypothetical protein